METITLTPTGHDPITFKGDLAVHVTGGAPDDQTGGRRHVIDVYSLPDSSLAVAIRYETTASGESGHCSVDTAVDESEVDAVLSLYEPQQFVAMAPGDRRTQVFDVLTRRYDTLVIQVLNELRSRTELSESAPNAR